MAKHQNTNRFLYQVKVEKKEEIGIIGVLNLFYSNPPDMCWETIIYDSDTLYWKLGPTRIISSFAWGNIPHHNIYIKKFDAATAELFSHLVLYGSHNKSEKEF